MSDEDDDRSGGVKFGSGNVTIGGDVVGRDKITNNYGFSGDEVAKLFASVYQQIDANAKLKPSDKKFVTADVKDVEKEVAKGTQADESVLERHIYNVFRMAPDILEVIASTFVSPTLGAATVIRKIIQKVKQEAG